jgi:hypothetical protein
MLNNLLNKCEKNLYKKKIFIINFLVFFLLIYIAKNFFYQESNYLLQQSILSKKINVEDIIPNKTDIDIFSKYYISDEKYKQFLNRECQINNDLHDRHKVRWVKAFLLQKIYKFSYNFHAKSPFYLSIFLISFLLFCSFYLINKTFVYDKNYNYLFLLFVTVIFQSSREINDAVFEMFFLSLAFYASKEKKFILFIISCCLAILNRESGFVIALVWLIFNNDNKKFIISLLTSICLLFIANVDIWDCLTNIRFFIPLQNSVGQFHEINKLSFTTIIHTILINFIIPFGLIYYFQINLKNKKIKMLKIISLVYFLIFLIAVPLNNPGSRLLLLPIIFATIHFKYLEKIKLNS